MWQSVEILNVFNILTLKQTFWKRKTFFKKPEYRFLVESTRIENTSFPYKTAISEANAKKNRMVSTKWTHHKKLSFVSNYLIFLKIMFWFKNLIKRVHLMYQLPKCQYFYIYLSAGVLFDGAFSLWVSKVNKEKCSWIWNLVSCTYLLYIFIFQMDLSSNKESYWL